jgi:hypothetical protein
MVEIWRDVHGWHGSEGGDCFELQHVMLCSARHDGGNPVGICSLFNSGLAYFKIDRAGIVVGLPQTESTMAVDQQIDRLSRQLSKQSLGPIDTIFNETVSWLGSASTSLAACLRQAAYDQPLTTVPLSCQADYLVARFRPLYARR